MQEARLREAIKQHQRRIDELEMRLARAFEAVKHADLSRVARIEREVEQWRREGAAARAALFELEHALRTLLSRA